MVLVDEVGNDERDHLEALEDTKCAPNTDLIGIAPTDDLSFFEAIVPPPLTIVNKVPKEGDMCNLMYLTIRDKKKIIHSCSSTSFFLFFLRSFFFFTKGADHNPCLVACL